jgi:hypothetical protein
MTLQKHSVGGHGDVKVRVELPQQSEKNMDVSSKQWFTAGNSDFSET